MPKRPTTNSENAFAKAKLLMPGGVSSPVRAFKAVGGNPLFIKEAEGCRITDVDNNTYIDYVASYGPLIAGHANERVVAALSKAIGKGTSFGAPTEGEIQLAQIITGALPAVEMVRFVNSGTEATMSAIRLARAATKRDLIVKCIGCYHGHVDGLLVEAGSGALTLGTPSSPGVPKGIASSTISIPYNDLSAAQAAFEKYPGQIATFVVEPIAGNMGVVPPRPDYLKGLRDLCTQFGAMLLFDEVMTGFRVAWTSAQGLYNIKPDITCLGKVIGGGLPVGAYGASKELMSMISPVGPVYQAGTLSGNPLAMAGGIATLEILREENPESDTDPNNRDVARHAPFTQPPAYAILEQRSDRLARGLADAATTARVPVAINRVGSMIGLFFTKNPGDTVDDFKSATACDTASFNTFFHSMLDNGVYLAPSMFEAMFVGLAHDDDAIDATIDAAKKSFAAVAKARK
jgi:glutamate-1-semialdehyde 2,1-aminomutase